MSERGQLEVQVQRWTEAGIIDAEAAARIIAFEAGQQRRASLRWTVFLAMAFGGILMAAGITLFVAAHWDELSPLERFSLVLFLVAIFHLGGALLANRFPPLSTTLHALGTAGTRLRDFSYGSNLQSPRELGNRSPALGRRGSGRSRLAQRLDSGCRARYFDPRLAPGPVVHSNRMAFWRRPSRGNGIDTDCPLLSIGARRRRERVDCAGRWSGSEALRYCPA